MKLSAAPACFFAKTPYGLFFTLGLPLTALPVQVRWV
jgi:hypothetical protein